MTTYKITIIDSYGWVKEIETKDTAVLTNLRREALEKARKCLPFSRYETKFTHLIYYYEIKNNAPWNKDKDVVDVKINHIPDLVDDETFYNFVDYWKPLFVGAIHRK